jgi:hypothetical protein
MDPTNFELKENEYRQSKFKWFDWENLSENKSNFKIDGYKYKKNKNGYRLTYNEYIVHTTLGT